MQRHPARRRYQRVFYGTNLANGITHAELLHDYGGTSWGWLPAPVVFTSYDYGAAISEAREAARQGAGDEAAGRVHRKRCPIWPAWTRPGRRSLLDRRSRSITIATPETDARFLLVTHKPSNAAATTPSPSPRTLPRRALHAADAAQRPGRQDADRRAYDLARPAAGLFDVEMQTIMTLDGDGDLALLYGRAGETGETVLRYATRRRSRCSRARSPPLRRGQGRPEARLHAPGPGPRADQRRRAPAAHAAARPTSRGGADFWQPTATCWCAARRLVRTRRDQADRPWR